MKNQPEVASGLEIWIDIGRDDRWAANAEAFHNLLVALDIDHTWSETPGGHDDVYWRSHVDDYLRFYSNAFARNGLLALRN